MAVWPTTARNIAAGEYSPAQYYLDVMAATWYRAQREFSLPGSARSEKQLVLIDVSNAAHSALTVKPVSEVYRLQMLPRYRFVMEGIVYACAAYRTPTTLYWGLSYAAVLGNVQALCIFGLRPPLLAHVSDRTVMEMMMGRARRVVNDIYPGWVENIKGGWVYPT